MEETKIIMPDCKSDNSMLTAMMANGGCNNMWNNPFMYLVWLSMFRNGNGFWGNGCGEGNAQLSAIQDTLNSQATNNLVMDAIKGNAGAIGALSAQTECNSDAIASKLCDINNNITSMGYLNLLANCQQTNNINTNFSQLGYHLAEQSCAIKQNATDNTNRVLAKLDDIEDDRKDREITQLTAALASANARAERQAELAPITKAISEIQAKQPSTATVPYPNLVGVPAGQFYGYGTTGIWG